MSTIPKPPSRRIIPTVGRVVWVERPENVTIDRQPECALITYVHHDNLINVAGFDARGIPFTITRLQLVHDEVINPVDQARQYAYWMPFQKGQAAKTEKVESDLEEARRMASAAPPMMKID